MAIIIQSKFKPFSYQELLQPVLMATQAQQQLEDAYSELDTKASIWDKLQDSAIDRDVYNQYKSFSDSLKEQADQLAQEGLTPSARRNMLNIRSRYSKEITPIEQAWNERQRQIQLQQQALMNDPTHMFRVNASDVGLRNYMTGNYDALTDNYSGTLIAKQTADALDQIKTALTSKGSLKGILPYQYERDLQYGYTPEQIKYALDNPSDPGAAGIINKIIDSVIDSTGIRGWNNQEALDKAYSHARREATHAVGTTKPQNYHDTFSQQYALEKMRQEYETEQKNKALADLARRNNTINPIALRSPQELSENAERIEKYQKFFTIKDGKIMLNSDGKKAYFTKTRTLTTRGGYNNKDIGNMPSEFRQFMDSLGANKYVTTTKDGRTLIQPGNMGNLFRQFIADNQEGAYDTYHTTEYDRVLNSEMSAAYMKQIKANARRGKDSKLIDLVEFDGKNGWKNTEEIKETDLANYTVSNIRYSKYGNTAILTADGKPTLRVRLPSINPTAQGNVFQSINEADMYGEILDKGLRPKLDANNYVVTDKQGNVQYTKDPLTQNDRLKFLNLQDQALSDMGSYGSQIVVPSKTETEVYKPFRMSYFN